MERFVRSLLVVLACTACSPALVGDVVINELHYDPPDKTIPEEFVELYNSGEDAVDLSGWFFSGGIRYAFPEGTTIGPDAYLVVAQDPETAVATFGLPSALGPFENYLANEGERIVLRAPDGSIEDQVDYGVGFPWPLASGGRGSSMELLHPELDNDLGSSWRASGLIERPFRERVFYLDREAADWHFRRGTTEASDPIGAWREASFSEDASWEVGQTPIGFGDDDDANVLDDMRDGYTSVYLRREFTVDAIPEALTLGAYYDDGCIIWLNGIEVARLRVDEGDIPFDGTAGSSHEAREYDLIDLPNPAAYLSEGANVIAIHAFNLRITSADFSIDAELFAPGTEDEDPSGLLPPSPGARNTVLVPDAPPQVRQVSHAPQQPPAGLDFVVTAKVTDPSGVGSVTCRYQVVLPGAYIPAFLPLPHNLLISRPLNDREPNPEFEDPANWADVPMRDDGEGGDAVAGDDIYTAVLPAQEHRTLVRYRIRVEDAAGNDATVPYRDDRSLNFACFVYDGVPPYVADTRSVHPDGAGHVYPSELLTSLPVYHLITRQGDLDHCIAFNGSFQIPKSNERARDKFNWEGAFVYEGIVYDHVRYRLRQANDRYGGAGKRSMRIRFNKGDYLRARDNWGRRFPERWRTLNTGKMFDNKRVGNFGLTEAMNAKLWNLVGVPAPHFYTYHFRVIQRAEEVPMSNGQYLGDFWGMYSGIEDYDPRFLTAHGMEDGNLYKLKDGQFNGDDLRRNQGRFAVFEPPNRADADFQNIRRNLRPERDDAWLDAHVNYSRWYPYHAVVEAIRHYDFRPSDTHSKNRAWYFEPEYEDSVFGRLWTLPWDSDASWGPNWNSGIDYTKNAIFSGGGKPAYKQAYRNFIREFRDLVWTEEVIEPMIDEWAEFVIDFTPADRDRWRAAPAQAGRQDFGTIERKITDMKNFAFVSWAGAGGPAVPAGGRARHLENLANAEGDRTRVPATPTVAALTDTFPQDGLIFETTPFEDPQGDAFAGIQWRVGEVQNSDAPGFDPTAPRVLEWNEVWSSGTLETFENPLVVPAAAVAIGHTYRVRVKMLDETGRWSHWSDPAEFTVEPPTASYPAQDALRITELMYNPVGDQAFEYLEIQNIGGEPIDLTDVSLVDGVEFEFATSEVTTLGPGEYVLVVEDLDVFERRYDTSGLLIAGEYSGRLANGGEIVELRWGRDATIQVFEYSDAWHPTTDGLGLSLVIVDPLGPLEAWSRSLGWRPSHAVGGSPGIVDEPLVAGFQLPGNVNQDARIDVTDAIAILGHLVLGLDTPLPCGDGTFDAPANQVILDINGDASVNLTDGVHLLLWMFQRGDPPALGTSCVPLVDCPDLCP